MFERFTDKALQVIMLAQEEARRIGHNFVGTEQILLGLIGEGSGIAFKALKAFNVNIKDARLEVERKIGRGSGFVAVEVPFTPRSKKILELAMQIGRDFGHSYISTEHLILSILEDEHGVANKILVRLGVNIENLRIDVLNQIDNVKDLSAANPEVVVFSSGSQELFVLNDDEYQQYGTTTLDEFTTNLTEAA